MDASRRRALRLKSNQYHLANDTLYRKNYDGVWLRCLEKDDADHALKEMHDGLAGGHYGGETTAHKILRAGYYWPTVFRYSQCPRLEVQGVSNYHRERKKASRSPQARYDLSPVPAMGPRFHRFGIPDALIFDNSSYFSSLKLTEFSIDKSIHIRNWHNALTNALWADRVAPKVTLGNSPYFLFYGLKAILPPNVALPSLQLSQASGGTLSTLLQKRINQLVRLEELRDNARNKFRNHQMIVKRWFDCHLAGDKYYQVSELVLKWDKLSEPKGKHTKFQHLWLGSFQVEEKIG
eukprot:PITA_05222